jgi:hypothetical protein
MSPQYREHGRRKLQPLPPSSVEHPWVLVCNEGPANQVAYLIREQENGYVGVFLDFDYIAGWELPAPPRLLFIPTADVLHVFPCEPMRLQDIHEAWRKSRSVS